VAAKRLRSSDRLFAAAYAAYAAYAVVVLAGGLLAALAEVAPAVEDSLRLRGLSSGVVGRVAEAVLVVSHDTPAALPLLADYAFSAFNLGLAGFLLWLRPCERTARLLAVAMTGTAAVFNLQAHAVYEALDETALEAAAHGGFQIVAAVCYVLALLLFPDGRLVPRWSRRARLALYAPAALAVVAGVLQIRGTSRAVALIMVFGLVTPIVGVAAQAYRYRYRHASTEVERQQSRLLFWALVPALLVGLFVLSRGIHESAFSDFQGRPIDIIPVALFRVFQPVFGIIPVALLVGLLRFRLWDVGRVLNRALVYGLLGAFVSLVYVGVVVVLGRAIGARDDNVLLSILATGLVAVAFQPVKERVQGLANQLVYGHRATPYEVLSAFAGRVGEEEETEERLGRMARLLAEGTGARRADVWLVVGRQLRPAASWPVTEAPTTAIRLVDGALPPLDGVTAPVEHQGELLGALTVSPHGGEALNPVEAKLLDDLAAQAGLVLRNVRLTTQLLERLEELRASRQRLVAAGDEARRQLERNLHDGAQQQLVALKVRLGLVERMLAKGKPVDALLAQLRTDTDEAIDNLRDLARGIYPPLLAAEGLVVALQGQARKAAVPVTVEAQGIGRYDQGVEAAVYFCCLEALQNIAKYANATAAEICLRGGPDSVSFTVTDDGAGFDSAATPMGAGLVNMKDRVDALGGTVELHSEPGRGTTLRGAIPTAVAASREPLVPATTG